MNLYVATKKGFLASPRWLFVFCLYVSQPMKVQQIKPCCQILNCCKNVGKSGSSSTQSHVPLTLICRGTGVQHAYSERIAAVEFFALATKYSTNRPL